MHGCGWDSAQWGSQRAQQRTAPLAASVASRYALGADGVGAARPGTRGSRVTASRYALGAKGGGAARPGAYMCSPRNCARCLLGGVGMSKTSCAARCSRGSVQGVLRAPAEGEGGVAHRDDLLLPPPPPRSSGAPVRWLMARGRRASGVAAAQGLAPPERRPRAAGAPWEARARAARVQTAGEDLVVVWWWWGGGAHRNSELPQAGST